MKENIIASSSPRRKELLKSIINDFKIISSEVKEDYPHDLSPLEVSLYISELKAYDVYKSNLDSIVIGADTTIVFNNKVIGKPLNKSDAKKTLSLLSNNMHYVVSAITVYCNNTKYQINSINKVYFKKINEEQINEYLTHDEYKDKAGSYAIQGLASEFIDKIDGEYEAIVGLPLIELSTLLKEINK